MARGLAKSDVSGDDCREYLIAEKSSEILHNLVGQVCPIIKHGQKHTLEFQLWVS